MTRYYFPVNKKDFFYAIIRPENAASARVAKKADFTFDSELYIINKINHKEALFHYD